MKANRSIILDETTAEIFIVMENSEKDLDGEVRLELLDTENKIRAETRQNLKVKRGKQTFKIRMPLGDLLNQAEDEIAWYRLRYQIGGKWGIISLSELIKDVFELRIAASERVSSGMNYRVRVRALQPFTKAPVKNVKLDSELKLDIDTEDKEKELKLQAKAETGADGFAILDFKVPAEIKLDYDGDLLVTGRKNGVVR